MIHYWSFDYMRTADELDFEIGDFRNIQTSMTLTLTLDQVIWHTILVI